MLCQMLLRNNESRVKMGARRETIRTFTCMYVKLHVSLLFSRWSVWRLKRFSFLGMVIEMKFLYFTSVYKFFVS